MNAPDRFIDWTDANQALLVAEFRRLAARLGDADAAADDHGERIARLRAAMPAPPAIDRLVDLFGLSAFERDLLLLLAAAELDSTMAALCAQALGQPQRPWPTFGLAMAVLPQPHWSAIAPHEPLRRGRLVEMDESAGVSSARLRLDERVLHFIAGLNRLEPRLEPLLSPLPPVVLMSREQRAAAEDLANRLRQATGRPPRVRLSGDDASGQQDVASSVAAALGLDLLRLRAVDVPAAAAEQAAFAALWSREAALLGSALLIEVDDDEHSQAAAAARLATRLDGLVFVAGREPALDEAPVLSQRIDRPVATERLRLWQEVLGARGDEHRPELEQVASQYRLGARRILAIATPLTQAGGTLDLGALHTACGGDTNGMPGLAQRIEARARWSDLVLPPAQTAVLQQIAAQVRHRLTVLHRWGFGGDGGRGAGLSTLFWGDSGTGKTLGAEVLASQLGLALYRIDLSAVVSKYIGETEKNLRRVFDAAEEQGAILLFDEADALFGKRSEVKDSHDRYANIEVSYLLQRMEAYSGLAILTSNHKAALDPAFQRRLRFVVHFPFPDAVQREGIWRAVFPAAAPLDPAVNVARLARLDVSGGMIRNIALGAAFIAADAGTLIDMPALRLAALMEAAKRERAFPEAELRGWT